MLGATLTYRLARAGIRVTLLESSEAAGGLAGSMQLGPHTVDRFYHVIAPSDARMLSMIEELGLSGDLSFAQTRVGFYIDDALHALDGIADLARFAPLSVPQRARLAWFVAQCQLRTRQGRLDGVPLERWVRRHCGEAMWIRLWRPLLDSRLDGHPEALPATYLWARTRRMAGARRGAGQGEQFASLRGGHQALVNAMITAAKARGAEVVTGCRVDGIVRARDGGIDGVMARDTVWPFDLTVCTLPSPLLCGFLPDDLVARLHGMPSRGLGVVCVAATVRQSVSPFYSINICEPASITTVIEASHVVGTEHTGGKRLLYIPRYCAPDAPEQQESDDRILARFTADLTRMFPGFSREQIVDWNVQRVRYVEPVHELGAGRRLPPVWGLMPRLALASSAQIYPWPLNGEASMRMAQALEDSVLERL